MKERHKEEDRPGGNLHVNKTINERFTFPNVERFKGGTSIRSATVNFPFLSLPFLPMQWIGNYQIRRLAASGKLFRFHMSASLRSMPTVPSSYPTKWLATEDKIIYSVFFGFFNFPRNNRRGTTRNRVASMANGPVWHRICSMLRLCKGSMQITVAIMIRFLSLVCNFIVHSIGF